MIDMKKQYRTRDGREVRIYSIDAGGQYPVHGAIEARSNLWRLASWTNNGIFSAVPAHLATQTEDDLVEVKPRIKRTIWVNVYPESVSLKIMSVLWPSKELADNRGMSNRIACVKVEIDVEEGEGL